MMVCQIMFLVRRLMIRIVRIFDQILMLLVLMFFITMAFQARSVVEPLVANFTLVRIVVAMFFLVFLQLLLR